MILICVAAFSNSVMKTVDIVPGILSDCFTSTVSSVTRVTKMQVLQYVQYLRISTKLQSQDIYKIVAHHVEKLGIVGSRNLVYRYFAPLFLIGKVLKQYWTLPNSTDGVKILQL